MYVYAQSIEDIHMIHVDSDPQRYTAAKQNKKRSLCITKIDQVGQSADEAVGPRF